MEPTEIGEDFEAGPQKQMVGVAEDDLCVEVPEFRWGDGLDGALGAYGHEDGSFHDAVAGGQTPAPGFGIGVGQQQFKHALS